MTVNERLAQMRLEEYVTVHSSKEPAYLQALRQEAEQKLVHPRMVSGHIQGRLLKIITQMVAPMRVLEVGTFAGYASISIAEALPDNATLYTIEVNDELEHFIAQQLQRAKQAEKVQLIIGDALEILQDFPISEMDLIYLDANKKAYPEYYHLIVPKLSSGAFLIADNTLWDGKVADPEAHDPQTEAIRQFNQLIAEDETIEKVVLPLRDGLTLIHKR